MFSRRSIAQTCQPFDLRTMSFANGSKYVALAEVPGTSTRMFLASLGPVLMMPTLLYFAGVPGALKPWIRSNFTSTDCADDAGAADAADDTNAAAATTTVEIARQSFRTIELRERMNDASCAVTSCSRPGRGSPRFPSRTRGRRELRDGRRPRSPTGRTAGGRRARAAT